VSSIQKRPRPFLQKTAWRRRLDDVSRGRKGDCWIRGRRRHRPR